MCIYGIEILPDNISDCRANLLEVFAEWAYLWKGRFQRRDFSLKSLTQSSAFSVEGSLFAEIGKHEILTPAKTFPPMTVSELIARPPEATL